MAVNVINNKLKSCVVHASAANASLVIAGNNSVSNITSSDTQTITGATITRLWYGASGSGYWNVKRGTNLVCSVVGTGNLLFDGTPITIDKTATLELELIGTANGFIMVELHKEGNH